MISEIERIMECLGCPVYKECHLKVDEPEDYPDGRCLTKDMLTERWEKNDYESN